MGGVELAEMYDRVVWTLVGLGAFVAILLCFISAPYGRHTRGGWGPTVSARLAWIIKETPTVFAFTFGFWGGAQMQYAVPKLLAGMYLLHYVYRSWIYPFRLRTQKRTPWLVVFLGVSFVTANGWVNAVWIGHLGDYADLTLTHPRVLAGSGVFLLGYLLNQHSDATLRNLRAGSSGDYAIPRGGGFRWVSSPGYLGEIIEWIGFAIVAGSTAAWAFVFFTAANLVPRARTHHLWYRETFSDYPAERKVLLPFVW